MILCYLIKYWLRIFICALYVPSTLNYFHAIWFKYFIIVQKKYFYAFCRIKKAIVLATFLKFKTFIHLWIMVHSLKITLIIPNFLPVVLGFRALQKTSVAPKIFVKFWNFFLKEFEIFPERVLALHIRKVLKLIKVNGIKYINIRYCIFILFIVCM